MMIKWFKKLTGQYVEVSEDNPLPVTSVGGGGGSSNVTITSQSAGMATEAKQDDIVTAVGALKWQGAGNILQGTVAQGEEKLIDLSGEGVTAIWIQASPTNTDPIQVGNVSGFEGAWVLPGSSEWFFYPKLYLKHDASTTQNIAYQAVKYS